MKKLTATMEKEIFTALNTISDEQESEILKAELANKILDLLFTDTEQELFCCLDEIGEERWVEYLC